ncbi:glycoside hydrolase family 113 [Tellurirhabdus rosea]|uniref:glycoside hydrolase family 113 n=1 Tax=Tellurirhabdus rosea TaxID=2674997 RepID=UPI002253CD50|nr:hypothetical protein [Tellurirhabdus rosea]
MTTAGSGAFLLMIILLAQVILAGCRAEPPHFTGQKLRGANLVAPPRRAGPEGLEQLRAVGGDWAAVVPYGFCRKGDPHFYYFGNRREQRGGQWWGETPEGVAETIRMARRNGLKVMLKPHVWMQGGSHLDLAFETEADWQTFEADYTRYVLDHARLADSLNVDLYCITTELDRFAVARPQYWQSLIKQVRAVYKGPLTYAANWDRFSDIPFWNELDFVGVDAYFPLSETPEPSVGELVKGWNRHLRALAEVSGRHQKPILFTEFGYRACRRAAFQPWESESACESGPQVQANAYKALLEAVWPQPWFAGGFVWKWFLLDGHGNRERDQFSPQGKPAEAILRATWQLR